MSNIQLRMSGAQKGRRPAPIDPTCTGATDNADVPRTPSPVRLVSPVARPPASSPSSPIRAVTESDMLGLTSPIAITGSTARCSKTPAVNPKLHGGRVVRRYVPDPTSPTGYLSQMDVHFPDDDLMKREIDPAKLVKLQRDRPKKASDFWNNYIGPDVDLAVRQVLREHERVNRYIAPPTDPAYKCVVCTLPGGSCKHTPDWVKFAFESKLEDPVEVEYRRLTELEPPFESMLQPSSASSTDARDGQVGTPSILSCRVLSWMEPLLFTNDRLNGALVELSTPSPRGAHATFLLDSKLFAFGGLCGSGPSAGNHDKQCKVFHPYSSHYTPGAGGAEFGLVTNELYIYSFVDCVWQRAITSGDIPCARMGHTAVAIDERRAFIFGGRTGLGVCLNDAFVFHVREYRWERVPDTLPLPAPRYATATALLNNGVVAMFGGRDLEHAFADLWLWDPLRKMWSTPMTVGVPPSARHGHAVVVVSGGRLLIMGGCGVGPAAENREDATTLKQELQLRQAAQRVGEAYRAEEQEAKAAGAALAFGAPHMDYKELTMAAGAAAAAIAAREADTKLTEKEMIAFERERHLSDYWLKLNSSHAAAHVDVVVLSTDYGAYTWTVPMLPPISGSRPSARMNFSVQYVPQVERLFLWGGCEPTATEVRVANGTLYVLNLRSMRWTKPAVQDCKETIDPQLQTARLSIRHAQRTVENARARAFSNGVPNGRSMELAQAEATLEVYKWRLEKLKEEQERFLPPPAPRYGHSSVLYGGRIYLLGGWDGEKAVDELLVLDLEHPEERNRRLQDEMAVRLERERSKQEVQEAIELKRIWYEAAMRRVDDERREAAERKLMAFEDLLSGIPAKTRGPTPRIKWASSHAIYVQWRSIKFDALGEPMPAGSVEYILSLKGGFVQMYEGMEVLVEILVTGERYEKPRLYKQAVVSRYPLAYATIKRDHHDGTFDVVYKREGFEEKRVVRSRLRPAKEPEWQPVYRGPDTKAALIDLVPEYIREREPGYEVFCCLGLQTINVDYPKGEESLMGDVAVCFTKNPVKAEGTAVRRNMRRVIEVDSLILYAWDGQYWGDGVGSYYS